MRRSSVYRLFAHVYRYEPDEQFLAKLRSQQVLLVLREFSPHLPTQALIVTDPHCIEQLRVEFCRLFIGPCPCVPPYESVHRPEPENAGRLWGEATIQVKMLVESWGLRYARDFRGMPDHASVEFELMYRLLDAEAQAIQSDNAVVHNNALEAQLALFCRHIARWLPGFSEKLKAATSQPFYAAIAMVTRDFLRLEEKLYRIVEKR